MASVIPVPMINAKVYRHFAVVTCAITLCVAVFADGEAHQAAADTISARQEHARLEKLSVEKTGAVSLGDRRFQSVQGHFGEDFDDSYGAGSESGGSRAETELASRSGGVLAVSAPPQLTQAQYEALGPQEQAAYLEQVRRRRAAAARSVSPPTPTPAEIAALTQASAARSGSASID